MIIFGRKRHDVLVRAIEEQAEQLDAASERIKTLSSELAKCEQLRAEAQTQLTASITRRADLRHENDLLRQRIAELTDGTSEPPAKEL